MIIKRDEYIKKLNSKRNNGLIKIITGIRRCGKSFLLFKLFSSFLISDGINEKNIIKIDLEDTSNLKLRSIPRVVTTIEVIHPTLFRGGSIATAVK